MAHINKSDLANPSHFISRAQSVFAEKLRQPLPRGLDIFTARYFNQYPLEELEGLEWQDLFGRVYGLWEFIQTFDRRTAKVKVFNPNLEQHGWLSPHTVIAILQKDMPFLMDSVRMEINRLNIAIHTVKSTIVSVQRDRNHQLLSLSYNNTPDSGKRDNLQPEALLFLEINLHTGEEELLSFAHQLAEVLRDVEVVVDAYQQLFDMTTEVIKNLSALDHKQEVEETRNFLRWMQEGNFTYLGYCEYDLQGSGDQRILVENPAHRMGLLSQLDIPAREIRFQTNIQGISSYYDSSRIINFAKAHERSRVHRAAYPDYVIVKRFDEAGNVIGESRFYGLYTAAVYNRSPDFIPVIRDKVHYVLQRADYAANSHDEKRLRQVLETFPRDELFQASDDELYDVTVKVAQINERYRVRMFMRLGCYGKFVSALLYVPRDLFSTEIRLKVQGIIADAINATEQEFTTYFSESILARVYLVFRVDWEKPVDFDTRELEQRIIEVVRSWDDQLCETLIENLGEESGYRLFNQYRHGFSNSYRDHFDARTAVKDIQLLDKLTGQDEIAMNFYQWVGAEENAVRFKIFRLNRMIELSEVIPILENLGLRVIGEYPHTITRTRYGREETVWLHDFSLHYVFQGHEFQGYEFQGSAPKGKDSRIVIDANASRNHFQEAFAAIWDRQADSDEFNRLVLGARLSWREVVVLRSFAAYLKQTAFTFSQSYIAQTLSRHMEITRNLIALFKASFDPRINQNTGHGSGRQGSARIKRLNKKIINSLNDVDNLNEDRIIRRYLDLINGCLRTNFFQQGEKEQDSESKQKPYLGFKFSPRRIPDIPEPRPHVEIFIYSPHFEGVHLRGGPVARGGLRWSDRLEDYRTEILGLVKAQQVKNAVIVPGGAKGGFVVKNLPPDLSRDELQARGVESYKSFIAGLLDLTDNLVDNRIVPPDNVVRLDGDDPYLVVAADKGTASFSDIANSIARDRGFWLGDAFASGGSNGYDHKKMGITARGAWVGVQRHFREQGRDIQKENFTVVGIGDMGGDVFGNGMLLSEHICLVAAFNHLHIFVDPNPDPETAFAERKRLFYLPKSSWADYDSSLISKGGGVFSRSAKSIVLTPAMRQCLAVDAESLTPNELIHEMLKAPVDLLWNGGVGTYVKASSESHGQVGDKANDAVRVNASELRCQVIGEGGNLGVTQLGRVEFSLNGGAINTDFIDNSAGVDCSDHEVNIKILLNDLMASGDLTQKQRDTLLKDMTDTVAQLVLENNYRQTQTISLSQSQALGRMGEFRSFITAMQARGRLDRQLEFLPEDEALMEREANRQGLTRPEISLLVSYSKVMLKEELVKTDIVNEPYALRYLERPFPRVLVDRFRSQLHNHRLHREIIVTELANDMVNSMGFTFFQRLNESIGAGVEPVARAYIAARDIYHQNDFAQAIAALDNQIPAALQLELLNHQARRVRRASRWLLRNRRGHFDPAAVVEQFAPMVEEIALCLPETLGSEARGEWDREFNRLVDLGLPAGMANSAAMPGSLYSGMGMAEAAGITGSSACMAAETYSRLDEIINLRWFANQVSEVTVENFWQAMAREAYLDDLEAQTRTIALAIIGLAQKSSTVEEAVAQWEDYHQLSVDRWNGMIADLQASTTTDFAMFSVALRELLNLAQASRHCELL